MSSFGRTYRDWFGRTRDLHAELAAIADVDPRWWLVAGTAAAIEAMPPRATYVISDAAPGTDTFIGVRADDVLDPFIDAVASAHAARTAIREIDGQLPDQPLAVTLQRAANGARTVVSNLEVAAFAIGDRVILARLADRIELEGPLVARLRASLTDDAPGEPEPAVPFVCISVGAERITAARHGHRRAWVDQSGPWLGIGRTGGGLATVSTSHMVIDGTGHAWLTSRINFHHARFLALMPVTARDHDLPHLSLVRDAIPLGVAWKELPTPAPRALPLAYALGRVLYRLGAKPGASFSPTFQIPMAEGNARAVSATMSVRFADGQPEPYETFAVRAKQIMTREAAGTGLVSRLLAATRAAPVPLTFKRRSLSAARPVWLEKVAEVIGGRACLSKINVDVRMPLACAVSSPARMATAKDPLGSCVLTIIDDGERATITACGSGLAGEADDAADLIDAVLALHAKP